MKKINEIVKFDVLARNKYGQAIGLSIIDADHRLRMSTRRKAKSYALVPSGTTISEHGMLIYPPGSQFEMTVI